MRGAWGTDEDLAVRQGSPSPGSWSGLVPPPGAVANPVLPGGGRAPEALGVRCRHTQRRKGMSTDVLFLTVTSGRRPALGHR